MVLEACSVLAIFRCAEVPGAFFELVALEDEVFLFVMTDGDSDRFLIIARDNIGTSILLCGFEIPVDTEDTLFLGSLMVRACEGVNMRRKAKREKRETMMFEGVILEKGS